MSQPQERPKEFWMEGRNGEVGVANVEEDFHKIILNVECLNGNNASRNHKWEIYGAHGLMPGDRTLYFKENEQMIQPHHVWRIGSRAPLDRMRSGVAYGRVTNDENPEEFQLMVEWINRRPVELPEDQRTLVFSRNFVHPMTNIRYGMNVLMLLESGGDKGIQARFIVEAGRGDCMED